MKKIIKISLAISTILLASCGGEKVASPIQEHVREFNETRNQANIDYGLSVVDKKNALTNLNCTAFDRAVSAQPTTLGELSSRVESMWVRGLSGCGNAIENMQYYESARRALKSGWENTLLGMSDSERILLQNHGIGNLINDQLNQVFTERHACYFTMAGNSRMEGRSHSLRDIGSRCRSSASEPIQCQYASYTSHTHHHSYGNKDYPAYLSELFSRYKEMFLHCSPASHQNYIYFHATVPLEVFERGGARFKYPTDPILNCYLGKARERISKKSSFASNTLYKTCARDYNMNALYSSEDLPRMSTPELMQGKESSRGGWLFDPSKANEDPQRWTFNECEGEIYLWLDQSGFNLVKPESIKNYCGRMERDRQRQERRNFRKG